MDIVECPDKTCSLTYTYSTNCIIYVDNNSTHCDIPCELNGCSLEVLSQIKCPFWYCVAKATTTPKPAPAPDANSLSSIILIALFVIVVFLSFFMVFLFRHNIMNFWRRRSYQSPFRDANSNENTPDITQDTPSPRPRTDGFQTIQLEPLNSESNDDPSISFVDSYFSISNPLAESHTNPFDDSAADSPVSPRHETMSTVQKFKKIFKKKAK